MQNHIINIIIKFIMIFFPRKFMPNADFSTWTSLSEVTGTLEKWSKNLERPVTGSLVSMHTQNNTTYLRLEH